MTGATKYIQAESADLDLIEPGTLMEDGTIYGGISPVTEDYMFVDADRFNKDSPQIWDAMAAHEQRPANHRKIRLPYIAELEVIFAHADEGHLVRLFNKSNADGTGAKSAALDRLLTVFAKDIVVGNRVKTFNFNSGAIRITDGTEYRMPFLIHTSSEMKQPAPQLQPEI